MGRFTLHNLLPLAAILATCSFAPVASAGYLAPGVGSDDALSAFTTTGASALDPSNQDRDVPRLADSEHHFAAPTSGGMTPQTLTPTSPSTAPPALPPSDEPQAHAQLIAWLGPSGKVWLPPPFSTGIFRPPRFTA